MKRMNWKLSVALVWSLAVCGALISPAYARPVDAVVEEADSAGDEAVCENTDSIIDGLLSTITDEELESLFQSTSPQFANAFNKCVDGGGDTAVCEDEAMETALFGEQEFVSFQEPNPEAPTGKTPQQIRDELRKAMREHVFLMVNLYWMEHDMRVYGYWDQDGDGIADRLDRDSYNGHGTIKAYPRPIPGARADGHYNCEYFAQYFRQAFVAVFYNRSKRNACWKIEYQVHAVIAFYYYYKGHDIYVFVEPQGGSAWFISTPILPFDRMPGRGQSATVNGIVCHNQDENSWVDNARPDKTFPPFPAKILEGLEGKMPIDNILPIKPGTIEKLPLPPERIKELKDLFLKPQDLKPRK